jgi:ribosome-associated protein
VAGWLVGLLGAGVTKVGRYEIPESELSWRFSRSSGPGGQSVNTADSRVELIFDLAASSAFPESVKQRALGRVGDRVVVIASEHRSQLRNRIAAKERLAELLTEAIKPPPRPRRPTKPTKASKERRITRKKKRGETKRLRGKTGPCDSSVGRAGGAILPDLVRWMISRVRQLWAFDLATARPCA